MSQNILTLSGWTQPSNAIAKLLGPNAIAFDYSEYSTPDFAIEALAAYRQLEHIVAWSMGGLLTVRAIEAGALAPKRITLVAPPYQFVNDHIFDDGMPPDMFILFRENYARDPERTITRFHGLVAKGDARLREVMAGLSHHEAVENVPRWLPWLDDLAAYAHAHSPHKTLPPTQLIQGTEDAIVPKGQADAWAQHYPQISVVLWENVSHAPHLHDTTRFLQQVIAHHGEIL